MSSLTIGVLDYESGNLHSVRQALIRQGASVVVSSSWRQLEACDGLVLPGVGAFAACMANLDAETQDGGQPMSHRLGLLNWAARQRPLLGICLGHQVLFQQGVEHGVVAPGLGLLQGVVEKLSAKRLPHIGWDTVDQPPDSAMFAGIGDQRFYFVHSYAVRETSETGVTWSTHEGDRFVAAIESGPIWGTQFHPEKSGAAGAQLLERWLRHVVKQAAKVAL